jgi:hypothetical protein
VVRQQETLPIVAVPLGRARPTPASDAAISPGPRLFGDHATVKRPLLLIIVFGFFLIVVGVTAVMLAATASSRLSVELMNATVTSDAATVRGFANAHLLATDLTAERLDPDASWNRPRRGPPRTGRIADDRIH